MQKYSDKNPVLNDAYEEPKFYYDTDIEGNIDYSTVKEGRRPFGIDINVVPKGKQQSMFSQEDFTDEKPNALFINTIREQVKAWRNDGYPRASRITRELLQYWFCNNERLAQLRLFFCQREAVETAIWLNEIADTDPNTGRYILNLLNDRRHSVSRNDDDVLPRTAFKMATGTGKTVVMAMLILYHYLNKRANPMDTKYADHFLLVAPGITIRDRLSVLQLDNSTSNPYERNDYYHQRGLIPQQFEKELGGLNSSITIINYQQFLPKVFSGKHASPLDGKQKWVDGKLVPQKDTESYSVLLSRILEKGVKGKRIVVINDEAHHCYLPKTNKDDVSSDDKDNVKQDNETARVWYEGLRQMKLLGYKLQQVYDLSATPYYLKGSGYKEYSLFPWVVSDFGLIDAIESGLVKIPYLPAYDNASDLNEPKLLNIYEYVKDELPKKGMRAKRKADKDDDDENNPKPTLLPPKLPTLLNVALEQFVNDYIDYERGIRQQYEEANMIMTAPPVMIIVCNNTNVSNEVFREIAGYQEGVYDDGQPKYRSGRYSVFSNYDEMGMPKEKFPSLLIDSYALDDASTHIDENFKRAYHKEIEEFKRDYAIQHGAGSADRITDADILREVVNTVGKPGKLGGNIKCVVSVSMLTEGWDANTVTHVCGIRAFGSQLLCEQVVGRALRRQSYDQVTYNNKTGEIIDPKDRYRYKEENITRKFPPEYARIIGVPFKTFTSGETVVTTPPKAKNIVRALDERKDLEIKFPVVTGYRSDNKSGTLTADYTDLKKMTLNFKDIPPQTTLQTVVDENKVVLKTDYMDMRDNEVIYYFARLLIREYYTDPNGNNEFQRFGDVLAIVRKWYNDQLEIVGGDGSPEQKRLVMLWTYTEVLQKIYEGIHQANKDQEIISVVLNYYNPEGSTEYVFRPTTKPVIPTLHSHVNYVVGDEGSGEERLTHILDSMDCVVSWVRNRYLGFKIPFNDGNKFKDYVPTLIAKVKTANDEVVNLIVECQNYEGDPNGNREMKIFYTQNFWLPAVNNLKTYGRWDMLEVTDIETLQEKIIEKIKEL